ncbi:hypothetical protein ACFVYG_20205 [Streptomyces sp. NPDC058256]|uniref:hypothetical protein n=1 Tax=Streptomyces sp. NPDC058256 TaxID=3346408 RepID=UPI0036E935D0
MPDTKTPPLYKTPEDLNEVLTGTRLGDRLYTAVHASDPRLNASAHDDTIQGQRVTGIAFCENRPTQQLRTSGSVLITPDGALTVRAHTIHGPRWYAALDHLGIVSADNEEGDAPTPPAIPAWTWRPGARRSPGVTLGTLQLGAHARAEAVIEQDLGSKEYANAMLAIYPTSREACPSAWRLGAEFFHVMTTGGPAPG